MEHGSNLIERIKTDLKAFEFSLIRFYPLYPLFPRSIKVLSGSGPSGFAAGELLTRSEKRVIMFAIFGCVQAGAVLHPVNNRLKKSGGEG